MGRHGVQLLGGPEEQTCSPGASQGSHEALVAARWASESPRSRGSLRGWLTRSSVLCITLGLCLRASPGPEACWYVCDEETVQSEGAAGGEGGNGLWALFVGFCQFAQTPLGSWYLSLGHL